ncbi:unnamed protein product [Schistosoma rodhaini]|uniref:non-specific serine/threonine protein kinase n=1 Tax=Schistosoma rodhaini TaxID=6188 RepID=A0AA85FA72_9TREM|nr:unnamed protein product [Schistosoma rodhaini]CAH8494355.1 unnamed protein product [Schistosoma rodhaini]
MNNNNNNYIMLNSTMNLNANNENILNLKMNHNISILSMDKSKNSNHSIKSFNDSFKQTQIQHSWIDNTKCQINSNGKYKIIRTIGQGNFAKVKLAIHLLTGREVAIKMIDKIKMYKTCRDKLTREVRVTKSINHPNIVQLYEVIETGRYVYLVMEYAKNGEMFEYLLKHNRMSESDARRKFRQILSAVQYCHRKNIVHRDLKAENLLLDYQNNIKLADFGFANHFNAASLLDTFCGSPPYAAPELLNGEKYMGPEVDVWALGVLLYLFISGTLPFEASTLKELHRRITQCDYRIPYFMSTKCELIIKRMLEIDPIKRSCLEELMEDPWINIGYEHDPLRPYIEPRENFNDPIRIALMNKLGFSNEELRVTFDKRLFNNIRATYLLLADTETQQKIGKHLISIGYMLSSSNVNPDIEGKSSHKSVGRKLSIKNEPKSESIQRQTTPVIISTSCDKHKSMASNDQMDLIITSDPDLYQTIEQTMKYFDSKDISCSSSYRLGCDVTTTTTNSTKILLNDCKISCNMHRIRAKSLNGNAESSESNEEGTIYSLENDQDELRNNQFVNNSKSTNLYKQNHLKRHFIIDRAQTAVPDSLESRLKRNLIIITDKTSNWDNLPYDHTGRATVPIVIYQHDSQYFHDGNSFENQHADNNNNNSNNNNNDYYYENGISDHHNSNYTHYQNTKYQRNDTVTIQPTFTDSQYKSQEEQLENITSNNDKYEMDKESDLKLVVFHNERKNIPYRSPLPKSSSSNNKLPIRINISNHVNNFNNIKLDNNNHNQSNVNQQYKIINLTNKNTISLKRNQPIRLYENNKFSQIKQNGYNNDENIIHLKGPQIELNRLNKNSSFSKKESETFTITKKDNLPERKFPHNNGNMYKEIHEENNNNQFIKEQKRSFLPSFSITKEKGQNPKEILDKLYIYTPNAKLVKCDTSVGKSFVKSQDCQSNLNSYESENTVTITSNNINRILSIKEELERRS